MPSQRGRSLTPSDKEAAVAVVTRDNSTDIYLVVGERDGGYVRWRLPEGVAKKIRRELNQLLD